MSEIIIVESPRLAWQGIRTPLPRNLQIEYINLLMAAGLTHLDAFGFTLTRRMPQMAGSEDVLKKLSLPETANATAMVYDAKGADRAIATKSIKTLAFPYSISEMHLRQHHGQSPEENAEDLEAVSGKASDNKLDLVTHIDMAFGNPFGDKWDLEETLQAIENVLEWGSKAVVLEDSPALATKETVGEVLSAAFDRFGSNLDLGVCLYTEPGEFTEMAMTAYEAGCRRFHTALGGVGRPHAEGKQTARLLATESVVEVLQQCEEEMPPLQPLDAALLMARDLDESYR